MTRMLERGSHETTVGKRLSTRESPFGLLLIAINRTLHTKLGGVVLKGNLAWRVAALARPLAMVATAGLAAEEPFYAAARARAERLIPYLKPTSRVLDLGCGLGRFARFLAPHCAKVIGVDPIPGFIRLAARENADLSNVEFRLGTGTNLSGVPDSSVDFVFSLGVFERLSKATVRTYLSEVSRVLAPDGRACLEFLVSTKPRFVSADGTLWDASVYTFWTSEEVRKTVEASGFTVELMELEGQVQTMVGTRSQREQRMIPRPEQPSIFNTVKELGPACANAEYNGPARPQPGIASDTELVAGPLVSVIIPTLDAAGTLRDCLASVKNQTYRNIEILVIDGGSRDTTKEIAQELGARVLSGDFGRSTARRHGATEAKATYLLFLDSDQRLEPSVVSECITLCESGRVAAVKIPERDQGEGIWAECRSLERQLAATEELTYPRFFSRPAYFDLGGHAEGLEDYMEDRDLYLRLRDRGYSWEWCGGAIVNAVGHVNPLALGLKGARAARDAAVYYQRNVRRREGMGTLIQPRIENFLRNGWILRSHFLALMLMPLYLPLVYGPRFVRGYLAARVGR